MPSVDYAALAKKLGGSVAPPPIDYASLVAQMGGEIQPVEKKPEIGYNGLPVEEDQNYAIPQAILTGGLKGLGRMAAPLVKAVGLGNDYTDAALAPENAVERGAGKTAQMGATTLALAEAPAVALRMGVPAMAVRAATSPVGAGLLTTGLGLAAGQSPRTAIVEGLGAAALGKVHLPGVLGKLRSILSGKTSPTQSAEAIADAEAILESKQIDAVETKALEAELNRVRTMAKMDAKNPTVTGSVPPAKFEKPPVKLDPQYDWTTGPDGVTLPKGRGPYPEIKPIPPSKLTPEVAEVKPVTMRETAAAKSEAAVKARSENPAPVSARRSSQIKDSPAKAEASPSKTDAAPQKTYADTVAEKRVEATAAAKRMMEEGKGDKEIYYRLRDKFGELNGKERSDILEAAKGAESSDVVTAKPAFEGQRSGATNARYQMQAERAVKGWQSKGVSAGEILANLKRIFKVTDDQAAKILEGMK